MLNIKNKKSLKTGRILGSLIMLAMLATFSFTSATFADPPPVSGQSQTFAIYCYPNASKVSVDSQGNLSCSASSPNEYVQIDAVGSSAANKKKNETIVSVSCITPFASNYKQGDQISQFACSGNNINPKVKVVANGGPTNVAPSNTSGACTGANCGDPAINCSSSQCDLIAKYVNPAISLLAAVFGSIAVISLIAGGIQYTSSGGDPQKVANAKKRVTNTIIAIVAFLFLYSFLQFLVPGGIFNR